MDSVAGLQVPGRGLLLCVLGVLMLFLQVPAAVSGSLSVVFDTRQWCCVVWGCSCSGAACFEPKLQYSCLSTSVCHLAASVWYETEMCVGKDMLLAEWHRASRVTVFCMLLPWTGCWMLKLLRMQHPPTPLQLK